MDPATAVEIFGLIIYSLLYTIILYFWVFSFARDLRIIEDSDGRHHIQGCCSINERSLPKLFYFFVLVSLFARIIWLDLHLYGEKSQITFGVNRLAFCTFFTAFTLVVFHWAEKYHATYVTSNRFLPTIGGAFVIGVVLVLYYVLDPNGREGSPLYETNLYIEIVVSVLLSLAFAAYGCSLGHVRAQEDDSGYGNREELFKLTMYTLVFSLCFVLRAVMFFYRPITDNLLPEPVFYIFGYFVPDVVPTVVQIMIVQRSIVKQTRDNRYIEDLYAAHAEEKEDGDRIPSSFAATPIIIDDYLPTSPSQDVPKRSSSSSSYLISDPQNRSPSPQASSLFSHKMQPISSSD